MSAALRFIAALKLSSIIHSTLPAITRTYEGHRWALAVKTLVSSRNGQTIFERVMEGAVQIDRSSAAYGVVVINAKNVINHDAFWGPEPPFASLNAAAEALQAQLRGLVIWNASSPHYRRALADSKGERLWRMQVREAGRPRRWC